MGKVKRHGAIDAERQNESEERKVENDDKRYSQLFALSPYDAVVTKYFSYRSALILLVAPLNKSSCVVCRDSSLKVKA